LKNIVRQAFIDANQGYSIDRIVADPALNQDFVQRCRELGLTSPPIELNLCLLNLRKASLLKGIACPNRTAFKDDSGYCHASEIAARFLEKRDSTTLDRIICDPTRAAEFDSLAADIAAGYSSLEYRWAALKLRKTRVLRPELLSRIVKPIGVTIGAIENLTATDLPEQPGLYIFNSPIETLYVGEASNLRRRVAKHLDHSDNKNLARWFWANGISNVRLELQLLDDDTTAPVRKALEAELIATRRPMFNIQRLLCDY
jgi:site-specific DNA-methyltransferase (adenine-specific)